MKGPYSAKEDGAIQYQGNRIFPPIPDVRGKKFPRMDNRVYNVATGLIWPRIARINHRINRAAHDYFDRIGALFTPVPLTTRMISSPGAYYGKPAAHTTDTLPHSIEWFDPETRAFLSESAQIYLELALLQRGVDQAYTITNSFRREDANHTHLSEFHHIEYEGKVEQERNKQVARGLLRSLLSHLLAHNQEDLAHFLDDDALKQIKELSEGKHLFEVSFEQALEALRKETGRDQYRQASIQYFGAWEEVKLTEIFGGMVEVNFFPLEEVPFYHAPAEDDPTKADNTDVIWPGYREIIGSGHRVWSVSQL